MKITSREKDLILLAIDEAIDAGLYKDTKCMLDEYAELKLKLKSRKSTCGNTIIDGFVMDCDGNKADGIYDSLLKKGWKQFYYGASYHWGLVNPKELKLFTYTEGDTGMIICKSKKKYIEEVKSHYEFFKENGENKSFFDASLKELISEV